MKVWKVYTNEHPNGILVHGNIGEHKLRKRSMEYTKKKIAEGAKLSSITYCYAPVFTNPLP